MHTITILVGDLDGDKLPVQIVPNDGLEMHLVLAALRTAENQVIAQLIQDSEQRGYDRAVEDAGNTFDEEEEETDETED